MQLVSNTELSRAVRCCVFNPRVAYVNDTNCMAVSIGYNSGSAPTDHIVEYHSDDSVTIIFEKMHIGFLFSERKSPKTRTPPPHTRTHNGENPKNPACDSILSWVLRKLPHQTFQRRISSGDRAYRPPQPFRGIHTAFCCHKYECSDSQTKGDGRRY